MGKYCCLARALFAVILESGKLLPATVNPLLSVAYLITEKVENGFKADIAESVAKHLVDSLLPIAANFETKLESHLLAITQSTISHNEITEKISSIQDKLEETNDKVQSNAKSYSQAAASSLPPLPHQTPQNITHANIQIRNREEIKRRQVLINFVRHDDPTIISPNEVTLSHKALAALNAVWTSAPDPKPTVPKAPPSYGMVASS